MEDRLTIERIKTAYERIGYRPIYGLFHAVRKGELFACPVCAVVKAEHGIIIGANRNDPRSSVAVAAEKLGIPEDYIGSFMTAYDGLRYDLFTSSDDVGVADGEAARQEVPPEWGK